MTSPLTFTLTLLLTLLSTTSSLSYPPSQPPLTPPPTTTTTTDLSLNNNNNYSPFTTLTTILSSLGYQNLALASHTLSLPSLSTTLPFMGPLTVFAPSDASISTCPTCSLPLLLQEHSIPGLYSSDYLSRLSFGTKIETLLPGRCLTLTSSSNASRLFIGGAEVTFPDLFSNSHIIVHGIQGFLSHLSPYSCSLDRLSSLFLHHPPSSSGSSTTWLTRMMLADAMIRLRTSGYSILALALRVKYPDLIPLHNMTIFAVDDSAIFHGGHSYVHSVRFHILPNKYLRYSDLERLPPATLLPTLDLGESLTVTSSGGGGIVSPMRINYVRIKFPDMLYNMKLVVHGLSSPFPRLSHVTTASTATRQVSFASVVSSSPVNPHFSSSDDHQMMSPESASSPPVFQSNDEDDFDNDDDVHQGL